MTTTKAEEHLPSYRIRPRFQFETSLDVNALLEKIEEGLQNESATCKGKVNKRGYATLQLPKEEQHYWSPQLSLTLEETETGSLIRGLYAPHPSVWTMFIFFYFIIAFVAVILTIIGLSNWYLGKSTLILWLVPVLILTFLTLYLVAYLGQRLGHDQMVILHQFLEESTGLEIDASKKYYASK